MLNFCSHIEPAKWKRLFLICVHLVVLAVFAPLALANSKAREDRPIQLHAAQILGYGLSVGYYLFPQLYVGMESHSLSDKGTVMDVELDYSLKTNQALTRYFPWNEYGFCAQIGFVSRDWTINGSNEAYIGNDTVKREATINITWPKASFSYGIGWFLISDHGLSGGFGVGFIYGSSPNVTIEAAGASSSDIALEEEKTAKTFENYDVFRYTHLSIGWNF
ncbi:MAG: hypothetical protein GY866_36265 [Proteobacteria bacterium]|nr:hypothetical protein [Pseudomonadota bacterium]